MSSTPGWYHAEGDPPGTTRYWDGQQWLGQPVDAPASADASRGADLAGPWVRMGARVIDWLIFLVVSVVFLIPAITDMIDGLQALPDGASESEIQDVIEDAFTGGSTTVFVLLSGLAAFTIEWLFIAFKGGTIGKLATGLRIADRETRQMPVPLGQAALRSANHLAPLLGAISITLTNALSPIFGLVGLISLVLLFADSERRTVMDRIGRTVVVTK